MSKFWVIFILSFALILSQCEVPSDSDDEDDFDAPAVPTGLAVDVNSSIEDTIRIQWNKNTEKDFDIYRLYRSIEIDSLYAFELIIETIENEFTDVGVSYNVVHYYRVSSVDKMGNESEMSGAVNFSPVNIFSPAVPSGFSVYGYNLPGESPYIELRWQPNSESDFDCDNIYKHTSRAFSTDDSTYFVSRTNLTQYTDLDVEVGQLYFYRITAVDKGLKSSDPTTDKSDLPLPEPVLISPDSASTTVTLRPTFQWQKVEGASNYQVIVQTSLYSGMVWTGDIEQTTDETTVSLEFPSNQQLANTTKYYWRVAAFSSHNTAANTYSKSTWHFWTL